MFTVLSIADFIDHFLGRRAARHPAASRRRDLGDLNSHLDDTGLGQRERLASAVATTEVDAWQPEVIMLLTALPPAHRHRHL